MSKKLNCKEEIYEVMIQASPDIFIFLDSKLAIRFANGAFEELTGFDKQKLQNSNIEKLIPDDYKKAFKSRIESVAEEGSSELDIEIKDSEGDSLPVWCRLRALYDKNAKIEGYILVIRDMHERRMVEENLIKKYRVAKSRISEKDEQISNLTRDINKEIIARERYRNTINALQRRMNLEYDIVRLSREFFYNKEIKNVDSMKKIFDVIGNTINAEHGFVYKLNDEISKFERQMNWHTSSNEISLPDSFNDTQRSFIFRQLKENNSLYVYDKDDLDEKYERELSLKFGEFESIVIIALKFKDRLLGFFGFMTRSLSFNFMFDDFMLLELVGNLFIYADIFELGTGSDIAASFTVQRILDISNDFTLVIDHKGKILHVGPLFRRRLGYKYLDLVGRRLVEFCGEDFDFENCIITSVQKTTKIKMSMIDSQGDKIFLSMNSSFGKFKDSHAIFMMGKEMAQSQNDLFRLNTNLISRMENRK